MSPKIQVAAGKRAPRGRAAAEAASVATVVEHCRRGRLQILKTSVAEVCGVRGMPPHGQQQPLPTRFLHALPPPKGAQGDDAEPRLRPAAPAGWPSPKAAPPACRRSTASGAQAAISDGCPQAAHTPQHSGPFSGPPTFPTSCSPNDPAPAHWTASLAARPTMDAQLQAAQEHARLPPLQAPSCSRCRPPAAWQLLTGHKATPEAASTTADLVGGWVGGWGWGGAPLQATLHATSEYQAPSPLKPLLHPPPPTPPPPHPHPPPPHPPPHTHTRRHLNEEGHADASHPGCALLWRHGAQVVAWAVGRVDGGVATFRGRGSS